MFLMPFILGGAALAGIPVVVHLLRRQTVMPIAWGAMQFLLESPLKARRRRRIDNWLLMLVRMAILAAVALILSRPVIQQSEVKSAVPMDVAVVVDHSMTMGRKSGTGRLFDEGAAVAEKISRMLPPSGTMSIVAAEQVPRIITPMPVRMDSSNRADDGTPAGEWAKHLLLLKSMKSGMTKAKIPAAVETARDLLSHGYNTRKLIVVVSDEQASNWESGDEKVWKGAVGDTMDRGGAATVYSYAARMKGDSPPANVMVHGVITSPPYLGVKQPTEVSAQVANNGETELSNIPVQLYLDGKLMTSQTIGHLAPGDSKRVTFDHYYPQAGSHWVKVRADMIDTLDVDNEAVAAVNVHGRLPILIVDGKLTGGMIGMGDDFERIYPQSRYLAVALAPDPQGMIDVKIASVGQLTTAGGSMVPVEDFPIVVLNDVPRLPREALDRLAAHAQRGNGVWIILGPRTEQTFINDVLGKSTLMPISGGAIRYAPEILAATRPAVEGAVAPQRVTTDLREVQNPAIAKLAANDLNMLADVTLRAWWPVKGTVSDVRAVVNTTLGDPLVLEMPHGRLGGKAVLWTTSVGNLEWTNLARSHNFIVLARETAFHLASGQDAGQPRQLLLGNSEGGATIVWTGPSTIPIDSATLRYPDGSTRQLAPELRNDQYFISDKPTAMPGLYEMTFSAPARPGVTPPPLTYYSVDLDGNELLPATLSAANMEWFRSHAFLKGQLTSETVKVALDAQAGGYDVWWMIGLLLLALLVLEVFMTYVLARKQSGAVLEESELAGVLPK